MLYSEGESPLPEGVGLGIDAGGTYTDAVIFDFARRVPQRFFDAALRLCAETDYQMKTSYDEPEALLELLVLRLAQEASHG